MEKSGLIKRLLLFDHVIVGWPIFPDCFIEGTGLTTFKKNSEYVFCLAGLAALILLHRHRSYLDRTVYLLISLGIALSIVGELFFTLYTSVTSLMNATGHFLHLATVFLLYQALVHSSLKRPLETLFRSLSKQQRLYSSVLHNAMDGFFIMEANGRLLTVIEAYCRMTGYKEQDLLANNFLAHDALHLSPDLTARLRTVVNRGEDHFESSHRHKDGTILTVEASLKYLPIENGLVIAFVKDISQRKQNEQALRQHEEDLKAVFNVTTESVHLIDSDGIVVLANDATAKRLATTVEELLGRRIYDFFPPEVSIARKRVVQQALNSGTPQTLIDLRSGRSFETRLRPIFNDRGKPHRIAFLQGDNRTHPRPHPRGTAYCFRRAHRPQPFLLP